MTRDDLEQLDTKRLRALAKQRFAGKARALRTRGALLEALTRSLVPPPPVLASPPKPRQRRPGGGVRLLPTSAAPVPAAKAAALPPRAEAALPDAAEPVVEEGFFLRPEATAKATRRAPAPPPSVLREAAPRPKGSAEARASADEVPHLLARDATTLFLFWDFRRDLEHGAAFGLHAPRVLFRLYDGESLVRTVEAPLGRRSLYLEGLVPGHRYCVEAWFTGSDGHARPTGRRSASVQLAPAAPSSSFEVQLSRVPWEEPLASYTPSPAAPDAARGRLPPPSRVELPASLEWRGGPGPEGPKSGRP